MAKFSRTLQSRDQHACYQRGEMSAVLTPYHQPHKEERYVTVEARPPTTQREKEKGETGDERFNPI